MSTSICIFGALNSGIFSPILLCKSDRLPSEPPGAEASFVSPGVGSACRGVHSDDMDDRADRVTPSSSSSPEASLSACAGSRGAFRERQEKAVRCAVLGTSSSGEASDFGSSSLRGVAMVRGVLLSERSTPLVACSSERGPSPIPPALSVVALMVVAT